MGKVLDRSSANIHRCIDASPDAIAVIDRTDRRRPPDEGVITAIIPHYRNYLYLRERERERDYASEALDGSEGIAT